jgi:hypothetical protein
MTSGDHVATFTGPSGRPIRYNPFQLVFALPGRLALLDQVEICNVPSPFNIKSLCANLIHDIDLGELRNCLQQYNKQWPDFPAFLERHGWPALFYAVATNHTEYVAILLESGVDPKRSCTIPGVGIIPLIAFTIINGAETAMDTSDLVGQLLCAGVDPETIPRAMW